MDLWVETPYIYMDGSVLIAGYGWIYGWHPQHKDPGHRARDARHHRRTRRVQGRMARAEHTGARAAVRVAARGDDREHRVIDAHRGQQAVGSGRREAPVQRRTPLF